MLADALKIAQRSPLQRYRTGAMLLDSHGRLLSTGWAHPHATNYARMITRHAEMHALARAGHRANGATMVIATLSASGRVVLARPCEECARLMLAAGVERIVYSTPDGTVEEPLRADGSYHHCRRPGDWRSRAIPEAALHLTR